VTAELKQSDTRCWLECARLASSHQLQQYQQAKKCYNRAIKQLKPETQIQKITKLKMEKFFVYFKLNDFASIIKQIYTLLEELEKADPTRSAPIKKAGSVASSTSDDNLFSVSEYESVQEKNEQVPASQNLDDILEKPLD
jgi:hypothetical protein